MGSTGAQPRGSQNQTKELPVSSYFQKALKGCKGAPQQLRGFPPSHRNEYVEWIEEAKTEPTREKRMATAMAWIVEGKSRNWKYERK